MHSSKRPAAGRIAVAVVSSALLCTAAAGPALASAWHSQPPRPAVLTNAKSSAPNGRVGSYIAQTLKGDNKKVVYELTAKSLSNGDLSASRPFPLARTVGIGAGLLIALLLATGLLIRQRRGSNRTGQQPDRGDRPRLSGRIGYRDSPRVPVPAPLGGGVAPQQPDLPGSAVGSAEPGDDSWPDYLMPAKPMPTTAVDSRAVHPGAVHPAAGDQFPAALPVTSSVPAEPVAASAGPGRVDPVDDGTGHRMASRSAKGPSSMTLRMLAAQPPNRTWAENAEVPVQRHYVLSGDDRIEVVLASVPAVSQDGKPHGGNASSPYLSWAPLPYDIPDDGVAFVCLGTGDEGCLFIDLAASPGVVAIGGDSAAAARLAESMAHQLGLAEDASDRRTVIAVGGVVPEPLPAGVTRVAGISDLTQAAAASPGDATTIVFCELGSDEDTFALARYVGTAQHRVVPVIVADVPSAPWSFTAQPKLRPSQPVQGQPVEGQGSYDHYGDATAAIAAVIADGPPPPKTARPLTGAITALLSRAPAALLSRAPAALLSRAPAALLSRAPAARPSAAAAMRMLRKAVDALAEAATRQPPGRTPRRTRGAAAATLACLLFAVPITIWALGHTAARSIPLADNSAVPSFSPAVPSFSPAVPSFSPAVPSSPARSEKPIRHKASRAASSRRHTAASVPGPAAAHAPPPRPRPSSRPSPAPSRPTPPPRPFHISGSVSCTSGNAVVGVFVAAGNGAGFSPWRGQGNGATATFWYTLPKSESYSLHVGCGGTPSSWKAATYSVTVSTAVNNFACDDVRGQASYGTCRTT